MKKLFSYIITSAFIISGLMAQDKQRRYSKDWKMAGPEKSWNSVDHEYFYQWRDIILD